MPKNKGKGGKSRRRGKNEGDDKRELVFKEDGQEVELLQYWGVPPTHGGSAVRTGADHARQRSVGGAAPLPLPVMTTRGWQALCFDGVKRMCHIRGKMRKRVWVCQGDIVLVGLRDYQARAQRTTGRLAYPAHRTRKET